MDLVDVKQSFRKLSLQYSKRYRKDHHGEEYLTYLALDGLCCGHLLHTDVTSLEEFFTHIIAVTHTSRTSDSAHIEFWSCNRFVGSFCSSGNNISVSGNQSLGHIEQSMLQRGLFSAASFNDR